MSIDRIYFCHTFNRREWSEYFRLKELQQSDHEEINREYRHLYSKGNRVVLVTGKNFAFAELYLFESPTDAEQFYDSGFRGREWLDSDD